MVISLIGTPGTVNLSGGTLFAAGLINNGLFNQTGGSSTFGPVTGTNS